MVLFLGRRTNLDPVDLEEAHEREQTIVRAVILSDVGDHERARVDLGLVRRRAEPPHSQLGLQPCQCVRSEEGGD
jgi:hypothetical protein